MVFLTPESGLTSAAGDNFQVGIYCGSNAHHMARPWRESVCMSEALLARYHSVHLSSTPDAGAQTWGLFVGSCCPVLESMLSRMLLERDVLTRPKAAGFQHLCDFFSSQSMLFHSLC